MSEDFRPATPCADGRHHFLGSVEAGDPCTCGRTEIAVVQRGIKDIIDAYDDVAEVAQHVVNFEGQPGFRFKLNQLREALKRLESVRAPESAQEPH